MVIDQIKMMDWAERVARMGICLPSFDRDTSKKTST